MPVERPVREVRLTLDEAAVLLALLELLPDDPDTPELSQLRNRWQDRLRQRLVDTGEAPTGADRVSDARPA